jgi:hypothetical protein
MGSAVTVVPFAIRYAHDELVQLKERLPNETSSVPCPTTTVVPPAPGFVTVSTLMPLPMPFRRKVAATCRAVVSATKHGPVPEQSPLQPAKVESLPGVAVSVTVPPPEKAVEQLLPQLITPAAELVTLPLPLRVTPSGTGVGIGGGSPLANVALAVVFSATATTHVGLSPLQSPLQRAK